MLQDAATSPSHDTSALWERFRNSSVFSELSDVREVVIGLRRHLVSEATSLITAVGLFA